MFVHFKVWGKIGTFKTCVTNGKPNPIFSCKARSSQTTTSRPASDAPRIPHKKQVVHFCRDERPAYFAWDGLRL